MESLPPIYDPSSEEGEHRELEPVTLEVAITTVDRDAINFDALTPEQAKLLREETEFIRRFEITTDTGQRWTYLIGAYEFLGDELATPLDTEAPIDAYTTDREKWHLQAWDHLAHRGQMNFSGTIDTNLSQLANNTFEPLPLLEPYRVDPASIDE